MIIYSKRLLLASVYKQNEVILDIRSGSGSLNLAESGIYRIEIVGGGGGGAYALSWASSSNSDLRGNKAAASGGSGACFVGEVYCKKGLYTYTCGNGGAAEAKNVENGSDCSIVGVDGEASYIRLNNFEIIAGGGHGGHPTSGYKTNTNSAVGGDGGTLSFSNSVAIATYLVKSNGFKGASKTARSTSSSTAPKASTSACLSPYIINTAIGSGGDTKYSSSTSTVSQAREGKSGMLKITYLRKGLIKE